MIYLRFTSLRAWARPNTSIPFNPLALPRQHDGGGLAGGRELDDRRFDRFDWQRLVPRYQRLA